ncbi:MAG: hypothetical protein A2103_03790 [Gammaproteobacteria bacterium GWF2_41_13]|nr:MAG: hypothetical protein A2103_03790 [Gammaproteobacteria bacterium GWF2_41_13]
MWRTIIFALVLLTCLLHEAYACEFDTDCQPGSSCVKAGGGIYGVCLGGMDPGNSNDEQPVSSSTDVNETYGNTCEFDTDCGPGSVCAKGSGDINGVCVSSG